MKKSKKRGRKPGPDQNKIDLILKVLAANPQGIWVREISRITGIDKSTVSIYLNKHLADKIEDIHDKALPMRLVRLKKQEQAPEYVG